MTENEIMAAVKISRSGLQRWLTMGCPYRLVNHRRRFDLHQVQAWKKANVLPKPETSPALLAGRLRLQNLRNEERQFKLAILKGEYVLRTTADKHLFESGRQVRDAMQAIPDRVAGILAAETDQHKCHAAMTLEIERAMEGLSTEPPWGDGAQV